MARMFKTTLCCVLLVSFLAILTLPAPVHAFTTFYFYATPMTATGDFSFQYIDADGDSHVSLNEIVAGSFSGTCIDTWGRTLSRVDLVPIYDPVKSPLTDGTHSVTTANLPAWRFVDAQGAYWEALATDWAYSQVPIPPSAFLLGSGLLGLVGLRRFRKR